MWSWPPPRARGVHSSSVHSSADQTLQGALRRLDTPGQGLTAAQADDRLRRHGPNSLHDDDGNHILAAIFRQLRSPMVLILVGAAILSFTLGQAEEATIVVVIVFASTGLGFFQEYRASRAWR